MQPCSRVIRYLTLVLAIFTFLSSTSPAQEVASVDLTKISARTDLRRLKQLQRPRVAIAVLTRRVPAVILSTNSGFLRTSVISLDRTHYSGG